MGQWLDQFDWLDQIEVVDLDLSIFYGYGFKSWACRNLTIKCVLNYVEE